MDVVSVEVVSVDVLAVVDPVDEAVEPVVVVSGVVVVIVATVVVEPVVIVVVSVVVAWVLSGAAPASSAAAAIPADNSAANAAPQAAFFLNRFTGIPLSRGRLPQPGERLTQLLRDFPDVPVRVGEGSGPNAPRAINGAVQERDAPRSQLTAGRIRILDPDRELEPRTGVALPDGRGADQSICLSAVEQVQKGVVQAKHRAVRVSEDRSRVEGSFVERLRSRHILDEQRDRANTGGQGHAADPTLENYILAMHDDGYFDEGVAARYDDSSEGMFDPAVIEPTVTFLADLAAGGRALELGIGTGRVALPLAQRGVPVHGIELSNAMVDRLRAKPGGDAIGVTIGDFATTTVEGSFTMAYLVFNTIMNLTTQAAQVSCFRNVASHLESGGCFVIEVGIPGLQRLPPGETIQAFHVSETHWGIDEYDVANQGLISHHLRIVDGTAERVSVPFRYAWPAELDLMAELAGMRLRERWSGWNREPFTSDSRKHVSVWEKPA